MNSFTIKDIENLSGIKAHTIRIWEQRYSFIKPQRSGTNIRYYSSNELKAILNIALLNRSGYKISHVNKMSAEEINQKILALPHPAARLESLVNELIGYMIDFETGLFEKILDDQLRLKGIDLLIKELIFPFLEKVGILWITNHINAAQEHLVTNIIRQKILVGIEKIQPGFDSKITALLFLPEGEYHEIGLLYVHYMLKKCGVKVLYLGSDVPLHDLQYVVKAKAPDYLYTHLTSLAGNFNLEKFLTSVHRFAEGKPLYVSGPVTETYKKTLPANVIFKKSLEEVKSFLAGSSDSAGTFSFN